MSKQVSIEYAHIYTNKEIGEEQKLSLEVLGNIIKESSKENTSLVVMVDDYSFPDPAFDYGSFADWLAGHGFKPNLILRESQLIPLCDEVLKLIEDKTLQSELNVYIRSKKYPCSLFIAAWYLLRLGCLRSTIFPENEIANSLINILPMSFKPFEEKGFEIIKATSYKDMISKIDNKYFEGRTLNS